MKNWHKYWTNPNVKRIKGALNILIIWSQTKKKQPKSVPKGKDERNKKNHVVSSILMANNSLNLENCQQWYS